MATGFGRGEIYLASFNSLALKTPCYTQKYPGYLLYKPSYNRFCPKFRCQGRSVVVIFDWHHSIARPRKPFITRKHLRDISYTNRVVADLVQNFFALATGVWRCKIWLPPFDSPTQNTPYQTLTSKRYLLYKPSYSRLCPKFVAIATGVGRGRIWLASVNSRPPKTPCYTQRSRGYLLYKPSYSRPKFRCYAIAMGQIITKMSRTKKMWQCVDVYLQMWCNCHVIVE